MLSQKVPRPPLASVGDRPGLVCLQGGAKGITAFLRPTPWASSAGLKVLWVCVCVLLRVYTHVIHLHAVFILSAYCVHSKWVCL